MWCNILDISAKRSHSYLFVQNVAYIDKFRRAAFQGLAMGAYPHFGKDWKFMARLLFESVDEADQVIDKIETDSRGKDSLKGLAWQAIDKCRHMYNEEATTQRLLAAIHHLNRKDIMDFQNLNLGKNPNLS